MSPVAAVKSPYSMRLTLAVLDDLGHNLYSSVPAVLSEAVANAWDADASEVEITLELEQDRITIADDGVGMTLKQINDRYLKVGYHRREHGQEMSPSGKRHAMGRKGIGKLSLFAIADTIELHTVHRSGGALERNGFVMETKAIRKSIDTAGGEYKPKAVAPGKVTIRKGTKIVLRNLKKSKLSEIDVRRRLARRFSILGAEHGFSVSVNGTAIGVADRDYFNKLQYIWSIGDVGDRYEKLTTATQKNRIDGVIDAKKGWKVSGWVGTFDEQKSIEEGNNTIVLLAWGKLIHEDVLKQIKAGGVYTKYLIGEIRADFLDFDEQPDITTSDRQRLKETDPRYGRVLEWIRTKVLNTVENRWRDWRREEALATAMQNPAIEEWYKTLRSKDSQAFARQLFGKIGTLPKEREEDRRALYRYTILAFEKMQLQQTLSSIENMTAAIDVPTLELVMTGVDELEAVEYHNIVQGRIEVIQAFKRIVPSEKERVIQKYLFNHLWLLHPSWERATTNKHIEESVMKELKKLENKGLTAEERKGRLDIRYQTAAGKHIIVELKKYKTHVDGFALLKQMNLYRSALTKVLQQPGQPAPHIEVIAILGKAPSSPDAERLEGMLRSIPGRVITYDQLIADALDSYDDYLKADERVARVLKIIDKI